MNYSGQEFVPYRELDDRFIERYKDFGSQLYHSPSIDHFRFDPMPTEAVLDDFYNGTFIRSATSPTPETEFTPEIIDICRGVRAHLEEYAGFTGDGIRVHDVGCGFGAGVWGFQQAGYVATGNEANREWVDRANPSCKGGLYADKLEIVLQKIGYKPDVFMITHVLEHLPDPLGTLKLLSSHLSDRGVVYICVPNSLSERNMKLGRRTGVDYGNFPMHLNFFTPKSMMHMVSEAGLEVVDLNSRPMDDLPERAGDPGWVAEAARTLHGGELFVLAAKPTNRVVKRKLDLERTVGEAHERFKRQQAMFAEARSTKAKRRRRSAILSSLKALVTNLR